LLGLVVKKRKYNVGSTYDGIVLVSRQFKSAYDRESLKGLIFRQLPDDADFLAIRALRAVEFDSGRRQTRFVKPCPRCGILESVIGATPVFLKPGHEIEDCEFVRTDLEFGSGDEKHPLLICGEAAAKGLSSYKFKGLHLVDIDDEAEKGMRFLQSHKSEEPRD